MLSGNPKYLHGKFFASHGNGSMISCRFMPSHRIG
uniref:Uncharacterized protein n=1 Tax=Arundo donax TaxID=35708 RepID=A0A0A9C5I7_ARUDO